MRLVKFFAASATAIVVFDAMACFASKTIGFSYSYMSIGSIALYIGLAFVGARKFGFSKAMLLAPVLGITDATLGWAIAWAIDPGQMDGGGDLRPVVWIITAAVVLVIATLSTLAGAGLAVFVTRRSATAT